MEAGGLLEKNFKSKGKTFKYKRKNFKSKGKNLTSVKEYIFNGENPFWVTI